MLAGNTRNIGYNFSITTFTTTPSTVIYFDPDDKSVEINVLNMVENVIRKIELSDFTQIGSTVGKNYNIKYVPVIGDKFIEIKCKYNNEVYRDLLAVNVQDIGQVLDDTQTDNFSNPQLSGEFQDIDGNLYYQGKESIYLFL